MSKPASTEALSDLHAALALALTERVKSGEATAADLNVIRAFLRDNRIEAKPAAGSPLGELAAAVNVPFDPDEATTYQ